MKYTRIAVTNAIVKTNLGFAECGDLPMSKYLLKNGTIFDGSGSKKFRADVLIQDGLIAKIGTVSDEDSDEIFDCEGLCIAPGFIDCHSHSDQVVLMEYSAFNVLEQGITTEVTGNCGISLLPYIDDAAFSGESLPKYKDTIHAQKSCAESVMRALETAPMPTNMAIFIGHGNLRFQVMGYSSQRPTENQLDEMRALLRDGMSQGAYGLSSGLIYPPGCYAQEEELTALCQTVAEFGGYYTSHIRSEGKRMVEGVEEAIRIGEASGVPVEISHHKVMGNYTGKSVVSIKLIEETNAKGQRVGLDQYPFNGGATDLISALPPKYSAKGPAGVFEALADADIRRQITAELKQESDEFENLIYACGSFDNVLISASHTKRYDGMSLRQAADMMGKEPYDAMYDLLLENRGEVSAIFIHISEWDLENIMRYPGTMGGVDGVQMALRGESAHPRLFATFPKIIGTYCREKKLMTLESCIHRLTGLPAEFFGIKHKGLLREGMDADIVVFDYSTLAGNADYAHPAAANTGLLHVFVNGEPAVRDGIVTGIKNGRLLRKEPVG